MIAGRLRYRLKTFCPVVGEGPFGVADAEYTEHKSIRAERVKYSPSAKFELHEVYPYYKETYLFRSAHSFIKEGWRVMEMGSSILLEVRNIIPDIQRGMLTLECEKVNE